MERVTWTDSLDILEGTLEECVSHAASLGLTVARGHGRVLGLLGGKFIHSDEMSAFELERSGSYAGMLQKMGDRWEMVIRKE